MVPLLALFTLILSGCDGALDPKGPNARDQLWLIGLSFYFMVFVMAVVFAILIYVLIRYRKRKGDDSIPVQVEGNHKLETLWTVIPILLILILAVPSIYYTFVFAEDYSNDKNALQVKVTGHQYWWEFEYPDQKIVTANDLVIPTGKRVFVTLQSSDVQHSFWIPQLSGKLDVNPVPEGLEVQPGNSATNKFSFSSDEDGVYLGKCAELCGTSHALMDFKVISLSPDKFDQWVQDMKEPAVIPDDAKDGEAIFKAQCIACHAVDSDKRGLGPNLNNFANREKVAGFRPNTEEWIKQWLNNPEAVKPGAKMPALGLSEPELDALTKYLQSLK